MHVDYLPIECENLGPQDWICIQVTSLNNLYYSLIIMEDFVPQLNSLVKYSTPVLVSVAGKNTGIMKDNLGDKKES